MIYKFKNPIKKPIKLLIYLKILNILIIFWEIDSNLIRNNCKIRQNQLNWIFNITKLWHRYNRYKLFHLYNAFELEIKS